MSSYDFSPKVHQSIVQMAAAFRRFLWVFIIVGILVPTSQGIVGRDDVLETEYLLLAEDFPSVGKISNAGSIGGSGVLIHQRWVLTAAHLEGTPNEFTIDGSLYTISEFIRNPAWDGSVENGNDLALARLSMNVTEALPSGWFTGTDETGVTGVSVGFGRGGTGLTGQGDSSTQGIKRAGENTIDGVGSPPGNPPNARPASAFEYQFHAPGDPEVLPLEGMAVLWDSGGPFFIEVEEEWQVAGIHSYVLNSGGSLGTYGDRVRSTRVSLYDEWITATIPEPSTWVLIVGVGAFGLVILRRK